MKIKSLLKPQTKPDESKQDLDLYWDKHFANVLETWGEDHVWNEIQMLLCNCKGKVLDIACGTGTAMKKLQDYKDLTVYGFDISDLLIERAILKGIKKEMLQVMDATKTNFSDNYFDYSYSIGSLEHFTKEGIVEFIKESCRYTKHISYHMLPVSRSGKDEGWIKTAQSYYNNSQQWWLEKFKSQYDKVNIIRSGWNDKISVGDWFICVKSRPPTSKFVVFKNSVVDFINLGKNIEAIETIKKLKEDGNDTPILDYSLAVAMVRTNRFHEALQILGNVTKKYPEYTNALELQKYLCAEVSQASGDFPEEKNCLFEYGKEYYGKNILNPTTFVNVATAPETWDELLSFHHLLATDEYVEYLDQFYRKCMRSFGAKWHYLDIINVLFAGSKILQPSLYLEIGVRRGRGVCTVARGCKNVNILAFDMWIQNYGGMENPGPDFVRKELSKHHHAGNIQFFNGNSHETIPKFFRENSNIKIDMITVDGDHTEEGAWDDLRNVIPYLSVGGLLIFDDIAHPSHPELLSVWRKAIKNFDFLSGFEFTEIGYGVAFAIRIR